MPRSSRSGSLGTSSLVMGSKPLLRVISDPGVKSTSDLALNDVDLPYGTN